GIAAAYTGNYTRFDGTKLSGPSLHDLVAAKDKALDSEVEGKLNKTLDAINAMANRGETVEKYDQMIGEGNKEGNAVDQPVDSGLND
ncbi:imelysin family protein, partial [Rhizobium johnstonii]|uniref:imelysin family protein n=1 Tax=Rhizobium johnstonii TaxID=3019933 RepID=UPI003F9B5D8A